MKLYKNISEPKAILEKWQNILRLKDWDIKIYEVNQEWRKSGDIKIDLEDRNAILMLNCFNPKNNNLEALIVHELLHVKLYGLDQMTEQLFNLIYGEDGDDPKYEFAITRFMILLETTVEDLAKSFLSLGGEKKSADFGRIEKQVEDEMKQAKTKIN